MKLFVPTLLGLLFTAVVTLADGIFVGRGVGSDALAAINIAAPLFQIAMGIALMFGSGVSIVAAIHLSQGNVKAARINMTQALVAGVVLMLLVSAVVYVAPRQVGLLFGGSERLMPYIIDYLLYVMPALVGCSLLTTLAGICRRLFPSRRGTCLRHCRQRFSVVLRQFPVLRPQPRAHRLLSGPGAVEPCHPLHVAPWLPAHHTHLHPPADAPWRPWPVVVRPAL